MITDSISLLSKFIQVRLQTEKICGPLQPEDYVVQPIVDVSPPKWHLGHTTWFFETFILVLFLENYSVFNTDYGYLFNSYYETVGARVIRTDRGNITRPGVEEVMAYRAYVDEHMQVLLNAEINDELNELLELGLQHEQQHQELLVYDIKYILGKNPLFPAYQVESIDHNPESRPLGWLNIEEGNYRIGYDKKGFSFDNEHGVHQVYLHEYAVTDRLITNKEYLEFIEDGGYSNFMHWLSDAWEWVKINNINAPEHWHFQDGQWLQYNLCGGLKPIDLNAPVTHISFYEADAFAKWKGLRLPTEFEWEVACQQFGDLEVAQGFSNSGMFESRNSNDNQFYGEVWEWTASAYRPYPYYQAPEGAVGEYNGKFMVNQMVLRGGSCATPKDHIRNTYRNFFHPNLRWMFSGLRLAKHL